MASWRKKALAAGATLAVFLFGSADAAMPAKDAAVAVMDFGTRPGATTEEININNAEYTACEYMINGLVDRNCFSVMEKDLVLPRLSSDGIVCAGLIDPDSAKRIGELLHVRYIIYGNVAGVTLSESSAAIADSHMVRAHLVARVMDVETGDIVMMVKGNGSSRSNFVTIPLHASQTIKIGTESVTMDSVHNAIAKAADDAAEKIAVKCGIPPSKKK